MGAQVLDQGGDRVAVAGVELDDAFGAQQLAWANKVAKGFNTSDVPLEFMLLHGEIAESFQAWRRAQPGLGEELADGALYLFGLAEMTVAPLRCHVPEDNSG
jgi:hypothetical protein